LGVSAIKVNWFLNIQILLIPKTNKWYCLGKLHFWPCVTPFICTWLWPRRLS